MRGLKIIFGQDIKLKWDSYLLKSEMLNIYKICLSWTFERKKRQGSPKCFYRYKYNRKSNKLWTDQGRVLYKIFMIQWLDNNDILMYSTNNECKSVIAERYIKTFNGKILKKW